MRDGGSALHTDEVSSRLCHLPLLEKSQEQAWAVPLRSDLLVGQLRERPGRCPNLPAPMAAQGVRVVSEQQVLEALRGPAVDRLHGVCDPLPECSLPDSE